MRGTSTFSPDVDCHALLAVAVATIASSFIMRKLKGPTDRLSMRFLRSAMTSRRSASSHANKFTTELKACATSK